MRASRPLVVLVAGLALLLAACGARLEHDVVVAADGSGTVECLFLVDEGDAELDAPRAGYLTSPPTGWTQTPVDDGPYESTRSTAEASDPDDLQARSLIREADNRLAGADRYATAADDVDRLA